ncbi:hypothetical protein BH11MYX1_BH11MYX1_58110 [soil metagenome]
MIRISLLTCVALGCGSPSAHQDLDAAPPLDTFHASDAAVPDAPADAPAVGCYASTGPHSGPLRIFFTSASFTGNLVAAGAGTDGLDSADCLCAAAARNASLGGKWRAWLSSSTVNAYDRITSAGPWHRMVDSAVVFANKSALAQVPAVPVKYDETGGTGGSFPAQIWTGTSSGGAMTPAATCNDWTSSLGSVHATGGSGYVNTSAWTNDGTYQCSNGQNHLYCIEQP